MPILLPPLARIAQRAGEVILAMQADVITHRQWEHKADGSIVTAADHAAQKVVTEALRAEFPEIAIVSEENSAAENRQSLLAASRFETDPLDNTAGYARGLDGFSVNLGRIEDGVPVAGAVCFPARHELFFTGDDGHAYLQRREGEPEQIQVSASIPAEAVRIAVGYSFSARSVRHVRGTYQTFRHPAQYRTMMIALGQCDIAAISQGYGDGYYNTWDIAGPHAVLRAAGGEVVSLHDRRPLRYEGSSKVPAHVAGSLTALQTFDLLDLA